MGVNGLGVTFVEQINGHYARIEGVIRELAARWPERVDLGPALTKSNARTHVRRSQNVENRTQHSMQSRSSPNVTRGTSIAAESSTTETQVANSYADGLGKTDALRGPVDWGEKVQQWVEIPELETNSTAYDDETIASEVESSTSPIPAQEKTPFRDIGIASHTSGEAGAEMLETLKKKTVSAVNHMRSGALNTQEAVVQFRSKVLADIQSAEQPLQLQQDLGEFSEHLRVTMEDMKNISEDPDVSEDSVSSHENICNKILAISESFGVMTKIAERLLLDAVQGGRSWTKESYTHNWNDLCDQFEWETSYPLCAVFHAYCQQDDSEAAASERPNIIDKGKIPEQIMERQRLLNARR